MSEIEWFRREEELKPQSSFSKLSHAFFKRKQTYLLGEATGPPTKLVFPSAISSKQIGPYFSQHPVWLVERNATLTIFFFDFLLIIIFNSKVFERSNKQLILLLHFLSKMTESQMKSNARKCGMFDKYLMGKEKKV